MRKYVILTSIIIVLLLTSCTKSSFEPIPPNMSVVVSVNIKEGSLSFINTDTHELVTEWKLFIPITGAFVLPDPNLIAVYGKQLDGLYIYDLSKGRLKETWDIGQGIVNGTVIEQTGNIFLVDQTIQGVRVFSSTGEEKKQIATGPKPFGIFQGPKQQKTYVINYDDTKLSVVDNTQHKIVDTFTINPSSAGGIVIEDEQEIWLGGHGAGNEIGDTIHIYSLATNELTQTIKAPIMPVNFAANDSAVFSISHGSSTVRKFDRLTKSELAAMQIGSNLFDIKIVDKDLYIASYDSDEIFILDTSDLKIKSKIQVGRGPFRIHVREGRESDE
ncbi:YncE family protein [Bacillus sp. HMF5848]|uniref:YncE family protein n=1 Tax=Bacillus sp. HMF5848 TaxID=2495421 RepID=UPI000F76995B|nr:YncE family protein [Bacillus sp. HMF5848]RSK28398.1 YncE family protein [Bacillus sp. HMF5848]